MCPNLKPLFWLFILVLPAIGRGQNVTVAGSPDWRAADQAQMAVVEKQVNQVGGRVIDYSVYVGGGSAEMISRPPKLRVDQKMVESPIAAFIRSVLGDNRAKLLDREPATIGNLPGTSLRFGGEVQGKPRVMVTYVVFSDQQEFTLNIFALKEITRDDPMVKSYLARIKVDPSVVAGDVSR